LSPKKKLRWILIREKKVPTAPSLKFVHEISQRWQPVQRARWVTRTPLGVFIKPTVPLSTSSCLQPKSDSNAGAIVKPARPFPDIRKNSSRVKPISNNGRLTGFIYFASSSQ